MSQSSLTSHEGTQSLIRAFQVFESLCASNKGKKIHEITQETGLNKSTIFRVLVTLRKLGYVEQNPETDAYYTTMKILSLSNQLLGGMEVRQVAMPFIQKFVDTAKQAVHLSVRDQDSVVIIEKMETDAYFRIVSHIGRRSAMYSTGTGKVYLASLSDSELQAYLQRVPLKPFTSSTICDAQKLIDELQIIRTKGYAVDREESTPGVSCVAAPIYDFSGHIIAAISTTGSSTEIEPAIDTLHVLICKVAQDISQCLGYRKV